MPKDLVRYQQTGDLHFVTFSYYRRLPHLASAEVMDQFEGVLGRVAHSSLLLA